MARLFRFLTPYRCVFCGEEAARSPLHLWASTLVRCPNCGDHIFDIRMSTEYKRLSERERACIASWLFEYNTFERDSPNDRIWFLMATPHPGKAEAERQVTIAEVLSEAVVYDVDRRIIRSARNVARYRGDRLDLMGRHRMLLFGATSSDERREMVERLGRIGVLEKPAPLAKPSAVLPNYVARAGQ